MRRLGRFFYSKLDDIIKRHPVGSIHLHSIVILIIHHKGSLIELAIWKLILLLGFSIIRLIENIFRILSVDTVRLLVTLGKGLLACTLFHALNWLLSWKLKSGLMNFVLLTAVIVTVLILIVSGACFRHDLVIWLYIKRFLLLIIPEWIIQLEDHNFRLQLLISI